VIFRNNVASPPPPTPHMAESTLATLHGPWTIDFPPHWGAPASVQLPALTSWTANSNPGVKYFSGTATYVKDLNAPASWFRPGRHLYLDLGTVRDIAQVQVNGKSAGLVWAPPYKVDVTDALKPGVNHLRIEVTNEWTNRILRDRPLPPGKRILPDAFPPSGQRVFFFGPREPAESGLIGDVTVAAKNPAH
jgi:(4-O-methyl)-D-glucuronate---lignin esterase